MRRMRKTKRRVPKCQSQIRGLESKELTIDSIFRRSKTHIEPVLTVQSARDLDIVSVEDVGSVVEESSVVDWEELSILLEVDGEVGKERVASSVTEGAEAESVAQDWRAAWILTVQLAETTVAE